VAATTRRALQSLVSGDVERCAAAINDDGDGMQILWSPTAIAPLLAIVFIITQDDGGDDPAALH
jgi:hypothetical protein